MPAHRFLFYTPGLECSSTTTTIEGDEHHHIRNVLRLAPGAPVEVTNGRGLIVRASLTEVTRARCIAEIIDVVAHEPPPPPLALALALVRKERAAQAVEQCTELGMTECIPFLASGARGKQVRQGARERMQRVAVAAMKQSHRAHLPRISEPVGFDELVARVRGEGNVFVGEQGAAPLPASISGGAFLVVGPEAGLGTAELDALREVGAVAASVSRHRLRTETAAAAMVSAAARAIDSAARRP